MESWTENKVNRGKALTIYIGVMVFLSLSDLGFELAGRYQDSGSYNNFPEWVLTGLNVINIISLFFYYGLWKMKKWGVYGSAILLLIANILILSFTHTPGDLLISVTGITIFALVVWKPFKRMT